MAMMTDKDVKTRLVDQDFEEYASKFHGKEATIENCSGMVPYLLPPNLRNLGHGIQLYSGGGIESKTFGCYLDRMGRLCSGYVYKNGSNFRVVRWENGQRINGTVPRMGPLILFREIHTPYQFQSSSFNASHFSFPWFDHKAQMDLQNWLMENGQRINRTVPRMGPLILFREIHTPYQFKSSSFNASHFSFPWFDHRAQMDLQNWQMERNFVYLYSQMAALKIQN